MPKKFIEIIDVFDDDENVIGAHAVFEIFSADHKDKAERLENTIWGICIGCAAICKGATTIPYGDGKVAVIAQGQAANFFDEGGSAHCAK